MSHCEDCPVAPGNRCLGNSGDPRFAHFCNWAASGTDLQRKHIVGRSGFAAPVSPIGETPGGQPTIPVSAAIAKIAAMKACEHWQPSSSCGCGANICLAGKGRNGVVSRADCFTCLDESAVKS